MIFLGSETAELVEGADGPPSISCSTAFLDFFAFGLNTSGREPEGLEPLGVGVSGTFRLEKRLRFDLRFFVLVDRSGV